MTEVPEIDSGEMRIELEPVGYVEDNRNSQTTGRQLSLIMSYALQKITDDQQQSLLNELYCISNNLVCHTNTHISF